MMWIQTSEPKYRGKYDGWRDCMSSWNPKKFTNSTSYFNPFLINAFFSKSLINANNFVWQSNHLRPSNSSSTSIWSKVKVHQQLPVTHIIRGGRCDTWLSLPDVKKKGLEHNVFFYISRFHLNERIQVTRLGETLFFNLLQASTETIFLKFSPTEQRNKKKHNLHANTDRQACMETQPPLGQGVTMTLKGLCLVQLSLPNRRVALWPSMSPPLC